ncbi:MAG: HIT family protein [Nitrososphaeria archaeon]|jgi:histidine triad (HIT) family protein
MSNSTCTFCKLVKKEEPANWIYEDEFAIAFLDINPISEGHTLVIPKKHIETIFDISDEEIAILFKIVKRVAIAVKKGINAEGIVITQRNGIAAGQRVPHLHVHIIPRSGEQMFRQTQRIQGQSHEELDHVAKKISKYM